MAEVPTLPLTLSGEDITDNLGDVLTHVRPKWNVKDVELQRMVDGYTDFLWKCSNPGTNNNTTSSGDDNSTILIVVYKDSVGLGRLRRSLLEIMSVCGSQGLAAPIYCKFENGHVYKYLEGTILPPNMIMDKDVTKSIIQTFHQLHALDLNKYIPGIKDKHNKHTHMVPMGAGVRKAAASIVAWSEFVETHGFSEQRWLSIVDLYERYMDETERDFPECFCHGDAMILNVIYNKDNGDVSLIDWDCCGFLPEVTDMAIFWERDSRGVIAAAGIDLSTQLEYKRDFLRQYLETHPMLNEPVTDDLVEKWLVGTLKANVVQQFLGMGYSALCHVNWKHFGAIALSTIMKTLDVLETVTGEKVHVAA